MKILKQIFRISRYFILVYKYQIKEGITGQGQCIATINNGGYPSIDHIRENLNVGGTVKSFVLLNVIELNKRDYISYMKGSKNSTAENEKL